MDIFTHSFSGLALGTLSKDTFKKKILLVLVISALIPDIDGVLLVFSDSLKGHRLATHSLFFGSLLAAACALTFYLAYKRKITFLRLFAVSALGIMAHFFLDSLVVWGVPLFYPFSDRFYSFNLYLTVLDPALLLSYLLLFLAYALARLGFFNINIRKAVNIVSVLALAILVSRFIFQFQASKITTLSDPILVPMNEDFNDFFFQRHWKAIKSGDGTFDYEVVDILRHTIVERGNRTAENGKNNCPLFTQGYLYTENGRIGDIRYTSHLADDPRLPQNCLFGEKF
jgi:membrane-bound metal-dependent hydrolase YbcI (DUF457 family)